MSRRGAEPDGSTSTSSDVGAELQRLREERDYLLAHSRNLEAELRRITREPVRIRELERRLADAEARLGQVSVVSNVRWLVLRPHRALPRLYRRFRESVPWVLTKRFPGVRQALRRFRR